ncbi:MAG: trehalase family glycosidase [Bdellovibrionota bacterium]
MNMSLIRLLRFLQNHKRGAVVFVTRLVLMATLVFSASQHALATGFAPVKRINECAISIDKSLAAVSTTKDEYGLTPPIITQEVVPHTGPSKALLDPVIKRAMDLKLYPDFKWLADLTPRRHSAYQQAQVNREARLIENEQGIEEATRYLIEMNYEDHGELLTIDHPLLKPKFTVDNPEYQGIVEHIERMLAKLFKLTPTQTTSSLIPLPHPIGIAAGRFTEAYGWDPRFIVEYLLKTGRSALVRGMIENDLYLIRTYGLKPNANRDYYLSRSQPPVLTEMIRLYLDHERAGQPLTAGMKAWLAKDVYPVVKSDYQQFWMNPETRFDRNTGLNKTWDDENTPRPERHSSDNEEKLGKTCRDVRAACETGEDFTDAHEGEATNVAGIMLNSMLYKFEGDLRWMALALENPREASILASAMRRRFVAINTHLYDSATKTFYNYNLRTRKIIPVITANSFLPLVYGFATPEQAAGVMSHLPEIERAGGVMGSNVVSGHQWDAPYVFPVHISFAVRGMNRYGYTVEAKRVAQNWVAGTTRVFKATGRILEKMDAVRADAPIETGNKYPTQDGFLWTNGVFMWLVTDVLNIELKPR